MPECQNCGSCVSQRYVRVFSPDGEHVYCCPQCPDKIRRRGEVQEARSTRSNPNSPQSPGVDSGETSAVEPRSSGDD